MHKFRYTLELYEMVNDERKEMILFQLTASYDKLIQTAKQAEVDFLKDLPEKSFSFNDKTPLRFYLTIKSKFSEQGYVEAPTVEMLEEKIGSYERSLDKVLNLVY